MEVSVIFLLLSEFILLFCYWMRKDYKKMIIYGVLMLLANVAFCIVYFIDPGEIYQLLQAIFDGAVLYRVINRTYKILDEAKSK